MSNHQQPKKTQSEWTLSQWWVETANLLLLLLLGLEYAALLGIAAGLGASLTYLAVMNR